MAVSLSEVQALQLGRGIDAGVYSTLMLTSSISLEAIGRKISPVWIERAGVAWAEAAAGEKPDTFMSRAMKRGDATSSAEISGLCKRWTEKWDLQNGRAHKIGRLNGHEFESPRSFRIVRNPGAIGHSTCTTCDYTFKLFQNPILREKRQGLST